MTKVDALEIIQNAQAAVITLRGYLPRHELQVALARAGVVLASGLVVARLASERDAIEQLGRSADMAGQTLAAVVERLEQGETKELARTWAGNLLALATVALGETPAIDVVRQTAPAKCAERTSP